MNYDKFIMGTNSEYLDLLLEQELITVGQYKEAKQRESVLGKDMFTADASVYRHTFLERCENNPKTQHNFLDIAVGT